MQKKEKSQRMSNRKKELQNSNNALKESLEHQLENLKGNFDEIGKNALWIGGGLVGAYSIIRLLNSSKKKNKTKVPVNPAQVTVKKKRSKFLKGDNLLSSTVKEQVIIFLLGVATQKLTKFLSELEKEKILQ